MDELSSNLIVWDYGNSSRSESHVVRFFGFPLCQIWKLWPWKLRLPKSWPWRNKTTDETCRKEISVTILVTKRNLLFQQVQDLRCQSFRFLLIRNSKALTLKSWTYEKLAKTVSRDIYWRKTLTFENLMTMTVRGSVRFECWIIWNFINDNKSEICVVRVFGFCR